MRNSDVSVSGRPALDPSRLVVWLAAFLLVMIGAHAWAGDNLRVLPGAASAPGAAGTHWLSDLEVLNPGTDDLQLTIRFRPFNSGDSAAVEKSFTVSPRALRRFSDVVSQLGAEGAGTLELVSPEAFLAGMRTYNENSRGSFGQFIPSESTLIQGFKQDYGGDFLPGIIENGSYRCNFGVYNAGDSAASFTLNGEGASLGSHVGWQKRVTQLSDIDGEGDTLNLGGDPLVSYISVIDNLTGDPTFIPAQEAQRNGTLVGLAHASGAAGSIWRSDLFLYAEENTRIQLKLKTWNQDSGPSSTISLDAGQTLVIPDVVSTLSSGDSGGIIHYRASRPVSIAARTYNQSTTGTFGQSISPAEIMDEGYFLFLRDDTDFRSNLALYNPGPDDRSYTLELYSAAGESLGESSVSLPAGTATQINHVVRKFGLQSISSAYLKVSGGSFGGYLSSIDNRSGDASTILPMKLEPEARVSGPSIFGSVRSALGFYQESGTWISVRSSSNPDLEIQRPALDSNGEFFVQLSEPGDYWVLAHSPDGQAGGRRVRVANHSMKTQILLSPHGGGDSASKQSLDSTQSQGWPVTLTAVVLNACDDSPVPGARVQSAWDNSVDPAMNVMEQLTDSNGRAVFVMPQPSVESSWGLEAFPPSGYSDDCGALFQTGTISGPTDITVTFRLEPENFENGCWGKIEGTLLDAYTLQPVQGEVQWRGVVSGEPCADQDNEDLPFRTWTDESGFFSIDKLAPGTVRLVALAPNSDCALGLRSGCMAYWPEEISLEVVKNEVNMGNIIPLKERSIVVFANVWNREEDAWPPRKPVEGAKVELTNANPESNEHGPIFTDDGGFFIFDDETPGDLNGGTSGQLEIRLTDPDDPSCTAEYTRSMTEYRKWTYGDEGDPDYDFVLKCDEKWTGNYTTTLDYSEDIGGVTLSTTGRADGVINFWVDREGNIDGTAEDSQLITKTTPGCTTTYDGSGTFEITGEEIEGGFRLFFDDHESFVYRVTTRCEGLPPSTETQTGSAELQYDPSLEVEVDDETNTIHYEDTHSVEHIGTYSIVLDAAME